MIGFFRRIRKNLANQNKFVQYSRYAIGEIVLVMVGILLALQVNNWNEEKKQQRLVETYLSNFIGDLKDDIAEYKSSSDQAIFKFHSLQHLLTLVGEAQVKLHEGEYVYPLTSDNKIWNEPLSNEPPKEFFKRSFLWSIRDVSAVVNRSSIKELNTTGTFSFIENQNLKDEINKYYSQIQWRFGTDPDNSSLRIRSNWQESLSKSGVLAQDISNVENPLDLIRNNPERIGILRELIRATWFRAQSLDILEIQANKLISSIESELSK